MQGTGGNGGGEGENQLNSVVTDPRQQLQQLKLGDPSLQVEEEASPISSRPPAMAVPHSTSSSAAAGLLFEDELLLSGERGRIEMSGGGNRWPRQETVALLKIRSEMDTTFRDANPKGPLWEEISRKLGELGFKRSAKKCKEKFENVHKYYKRTKEGRAGRQDGKSYKFFTELEALAAATSSSSMQPPQLPPPATISAGTGFPSPAPISSSIRFQPNLMFSITPPPISAAPPTSITGKAAATHVGISFSSDTNSSFASDSSDNHERKRKRTSSLSPPMMNSAGNERMVEFFEKLMNQVLQKQETMQQRFLEAIERREHDRMIREEAWKRQEIIRLAKEQDLIAQERAMSASRDSAIITFLQKITGQTIQLPPHPTIPTIPTIPVVPVPVSIPPPPPSSSLSPIQPTPILSRELVMATPEHRPPHEMSTAEPSSSRWPKEEILALIEMRSGLEYRYQESGPKGPLWEEISAGMNRMGYKRNAKRCKEKWENINKYYKKVKESKKKRSDDTKTCPYYNQLDELYRNKVLGGVNIINTKPEEQQPQQEHEGASGGDDGLTANLFGEGSLKKKTV
ncbi:trihelix transcription factor GTL1-like isoform X2 [Impatiens glandulifera]|uniref:trihelix transcription factor GTL1-like isoform X2 n=1 Tax=Impatiens glandulifera TaxID=253017 RepID=UPI001FB0CFAD|nr:trihelix transcription factor GTL1-like isoform X2 [Impatiens glandulifera]